VISFNVHSISAFVTSSLETKESIVKKDFNAPHVFVQYFRRG